MKKILISAGKIQDGKELEQEITEKKVQGNHTVKPAARQPAVRSHSYKSFTTIIYQASSFELTLG